MDKMADKKMGFWSVFFLGINGIVGSGIFLLPGKIYAQAGNFDVGLIVIAAIATLLIALCFADMASRFTGDGAAWLYTYNAFGRLPGFEIGFFSWLQGIITIAAEVAAFLSTLATLFPDVLKTGWYQTIGIGLIVVLALINLVGADFSDIADNISSVTKVFVLGMFVLIGIWMIHPTFLTNAPQHSFGDLNQSFNSVFYMFSGFTFLPVAANNMVNPKKNLPKALIAVIVAVTAIYALVQVTAVGLLGGQIAQSNAPVAVAFAQVLGPVGKLIIVLGMLVSILGVAISVTFSTPYIASSLATEHQLLPKFLGQTNKGGVPVTAIIFTTAISSLLLLSGDYLFLVACVVIVALVQYIATGLATIKIQRVDKSDHDGWRLPGGWIIPVIAILVSIYIAFSVSTTVLLFGLASIIVGLLLYALDWYIEKNRKQAQH
ncbi:hypothetical protein IV56_GL001707 [Lacticaseibacillus saniviri JCM 17471 = DSM 24301]|uniref:Amino acid permease n=2 Tax=Lacticaseibacillus saniviri TaxID=931533 RepID=A0A0R2MZS1_9LACO|nr:hypothetical protein IV56_GL001707 [Lacticaseibacillus saniviri JCM 17471 = DSM 24301]